MSERTLVPTKRSIINTRFCGATRKDHARDCASSLPCPRGDECPEGQECFSGSPCALVVDQAAGAAAAANAEGSNGDDGGGYCGSGLDALLTKVSLDTRVDNLRAHFLTS